MSKLPKAEFLIIFDQESTALKYYFNLALKRQKHIGDLGNSSFYKQWKF